MSNSEALDPSPVIDRPTFKTDKAKTDKANNDKPGAARAGFALAPQETFRGIVMIVASTLFFSGADVITKVLAPTLPAIEIAWMRYTVFAGLLIPLVLKQGAGVVLRSRRPELQVLRAIGMVGSALLFTAGLGFLAVAEATATTFVSPIFITALSIVFLGEVVGWRRWTAAAVGLFGVMVIVRPGTGAFQAAAMFPLLAALSWAGAVIVTRKMSGADHPTTTLTYSALIGFAVLTVLLPFNWVVPSWREIGLGVGLGILSTIGHGLVVLAYRHASALIIAPFSYFQLIGSGALAFLVFGSVPDRWTFVGAGIIAASGLYTAHRERVRGQDRTAPAPAAAASRGRADATGAGPIPLQVPADKAA